MVDISDETYTETALVA